MTPIPIRAYMAGPYVFQPDAAIALFRERVCGLCEGSLQRVVIPIFPMDPIPALQPNRPPFTMDITDPQKIAAHCRRHIARCDVIIADVTPFRGVQPDPGTVLEIGIAHGAGKRVVLYTRGNVPSLRERLTTEGFMKPRDERDREGFFVEDFGLPVDTMLSAYPCFESVEEALRYELDLRVAPAALGGPGL